MSIVKLLGAKATSDLFGVTKKTVYNWRDDGAPHVLSPLRFNVDALRRWLIDHGRLDPEPRQEPEAPPPPPVEKKRGGKRRRKSGRSTRRTPAVVRDEVADLASDVRVDFDQLRTVLREREFTETEVRRIAHALKLAKASKEQVEVDKRKVELAKRMGELIPRAEAIDERAAAFAIVRTRVMQISARCAADVVALGGQIAEVEERIRAECVWALEELSRGS